MSELDIKLQRDRFGKVKTSTWQDFLETGPIGTWTATDLDFHSDGFYPSEIPGSGGRSFEPETKLKAAFPLVLLYCQECNARINHDARGMFKSITLRKNEADGLMLEYHCKACTVMSRHFFAIMAALTEKHDSPLFKKVGQNPPLGGRLPNIVLKLGSSREADWMKKGHNCENLGYGIGAFSYYRLTLEATHKTLLKKLRALCETEAQRRVMDEALAENGFSDSLEKAQAAIPDSLYIGGKEGGHNPMTLLYSLFSKHLHDTEADDAKALKAAKAALHLMEMLLQRVQDENRFKDEAKAALQTIGDILQSPDKSKPSPETAPEN